MKKSITTYTVEVLTFWSKNHVVGDWVVATDTAHNRSYASIYEQRALAVRKAKALKKSGFRARIVVKTTIEL